MFNFFRFSWVYSTIVLSLFILIYVSIPPATYSDVVSNNQTKTHNNFIITFSSKGGFARQYYSLLYNSTDNHLIANHQNYDAIVGGILSQTLTDTELSDKQQETLRKIIEDSDFFNISFKNEKPECCDIVYYDLVIISGDRINSILWTSSNYDNYSNYKKIPVEVTNLVETLSKFTENSTELYSQSKIKDTS